MNSIKLLAASLAIAMMLASCKSDEDYYEIPSGRTDNTEQNQEPAGQEDLTAYNSICGTYSVSANGYYEDEEGNVQNGPFTWDKIYIQPLVQGKTLDVWFIYEDEGKEYYYEAILDYVAESGGLEFNTCKSYEWEDDDYGTVEDWQYAYFKEGDDLYYITGDYTIATSKGLNDGKIEFASAGELELDGGETINLIGMRLVGSLIDYEDGSYSYNYLDLPFPCTFTRTGDLPAASSMRKPINRINKRNFSIVK